MPETRTGSATLRANGGWPTESVGSIKAAFKLLKHGPGLCEGTKREN